VIHPVDDTTTALVRMAMDAANMRQLAHASNIAAAGTEGHVPVRVEFEEHLGAVRDALQTGRADAAALSGAREATLVHDTGTSVKLDQEVAAMSQNALHYQALVKLLDKQYSMVSIAIDGGKR
jgi:flagellar basal-body rod protein FlgB